MFNTFDYLIKAIMPKIYSVTGIDDLALILGASALMGGGTAGLSALLAKQNKPDASQYNTDVLHGHFQEIPGVINWQKMLEERSAGRGLSLIDPGEYSSPFIDSVWNRYKTETAPMTESSLASRGISRSPLAADAIEKNRRTAEIETRKILADALNQRNQLTEKARQNALGLQLEGFKMDEFVKGQKLGEMQQNLNTRMGIDQNALNSLLTAPSVGFTTAGNVGGVLEANQQQQTQQDLINAILTAGKTGTPTINTGVKKQGLPQDDEMDFFKKLLRGR